MRSETSGEFDVAVNTLCASCNKHCPMLVALRYHNKPIYLCMHCLEDMRCSLLRGPRTEVEAWKKIPGYSYYEVSSLGRVRSWRLKGSSSKKRLPKPWLLKTPVAKTGYYTVCLSGLEGSQRSSAVHRYMAEAFFGKAKTGQVCRHLDDNKANNSLANLAWGSQRDNVLDAFRNGTRNGDAFKKLTATQVRYVLRSKRTNKDLAAKFGVHPCTIYDIRRGKTWKEIPRAQ